MGAFLGALIGRHLAHTEEARERSRDFVLAPLIDRRQNPTSPKYTNEQFDSAIKLGYQLGYLNKHDKPILDAHFNDMKAQWDAARQKDANAAALTELNNANQNKNLGVPNTNGSTPQAQAPAPQAQTQPPASAIMQMLAAAKAPQQQQGGMQNTMQGQPSPQVLPGAPPPKLQAGMIPEPPEQFPFANGPMAAGASGPMQQNENPQMAQAAVKGAEGFNTPPPTTVTVASSKPQTFGWATLMGGMDPEAYAAREGRTQALTARPTEEMKGDVARQQIPLNYQAKKAAFQNEPWFKSLPPLYQGEVLSGITLPGANAFHSVSGITPSREGDINLSGEPVEPGTPSKRILIGGQWFAEPQMVRNVIKDTINPDGSIKRTGLNPYTLQSSEPIAGLTSAPIVRELPVQHADGTTSRVGVTRTGMIVSSDARLNGFNIAAFPKETQGLKIRDDGDGNFSLVPVSTFSGPMLQRGGGGATTPAAPPPAAPAAQPGVTTPAATPNGTAAAPPNQLPYPPGPAMGGTGTGGTSAVPRVPQARVTGAAIPFGSRSIPPGQRMTFEGKDKAFTATIDLVKQVQNSLPLMNSMLNAGKLEFMASPDPEDPMKKILVVVTKRGVLPMTAEEEKLVANIESLTEHINTLRGPLGAAGFRGPEAFAALQRQRGDLLQRPGITKVLLENTMNALQGQHNVLRQGLDKGKPIPQYLHDMPTPASAIDNPPPNTPTRESLEDIFGKKK